MLHRIIASLRSHLQAAQQASATARTVDPSSGKLQFDGEAIIYVSQHYGSFTIRLADVIAVGEYTTDEGPGIDDWFVVFVTHDREWFGASMYADGHRECIKALGVILGQSLDSRLYASASYASNVIWPPEIANRPLFVVQEDTAVVAPEIQSRFTADDAP
jgi:hypothetical protein